LQANEASVFLVDILAFIRSLVLTLSSGNVPEFGYWSYLILALLVLIEGPIAILLASAASSAGLMRPVLVFFSAAIGNLTADSLWWLLGYAAKPSGFTRSVGGFEFARASSNTSSTI
jgi:membrane protein DedA with SNARE-associated domain